MTDLKFNTTQARNLPRLFVNNGDGTFSEKVNVDFSGADFSGATIELAASVGIKDTATDAELQLSASDELVASTKVGVVARVVGLLATLGAVTASPTANTVLDRLKTIAANIVLGTTATDAVTTATTALGTKIGEVQASPTANTLLDRLKSVYGQLVLLVAKNPEAAATLTKGSAVVMGGTSGVLVDASAPRTIVIVSSADGNDPASICITGGTAALDSGIGIKGGETIEIVGKAAQSAMTQFGTDTQKLTVYTG